MRRVLAGAVILATTGLGIALAATGAIVVASPPVTVVRQAASTAGSGSATLANSGDASVTVASLDPDGTCDDGVTTTAALPLAIPAGQARSVGIACSAVPDPSIRRCLFHARTAAHAPVADYTALCASTGTFALGLAPASVAFGDVAIGAQRTLTVTVKNTGSTKATQVVLQLADQAGDFAIGTPCPLDSAGCTTGAAIAPGSPLAVDVRCTPTRTGALSTQLYVVTSNGGAAGPYAITCTGTPGGAGPSIAFDRTSLDVGDVDVTAGTAATTFHVANRGAADLHLSSMRLTGGAAADWAFVATAPCAAAPCTLAPGAQIDVTATFDPSAIGHRRATLEIRSDDLSHPTSSIALAGTGTGATLALDPRAAIAGTVELGSVAVSASASVALVLRDDGNAPLASVALAIAQDTPVFVVTPDALTIDSFGQTSVTVTCTPSDHDAFTGTLTITAPGALAGSPIVLPLTCTGVAGNLTAAPTPIALGEIRTGAGMVMKTIVLDTLGGTLALTQAPELAAPVAGLAVTAPSATTVTPATPATFAIVVDPQQDGSLAATVEVAAGADALALPVTGQIVTPAVTASTTRDLGSFCVGQPTAFATVSLTASGTASVLLPSPPVMALGDTSPFAIEPVIPTRFPYPLLAGARAAAEVTAKRENVAGAVIDDVVWATDVPGAAAPRTTLQATFIDDGGAVSPGAIEFGTAPIHLALPTDQTITIQNCGATAMTLGVPAISPAGTFHLSGALPAQLLPAQAATIAVGFGPVTVGDFTSTLTIPATKGTDMFDLQVVLHGVGEIDTPPPGADAGPGGGGDDGGGCGCGTTGRDGAPVGMILIAGAAYLLRRRRR